MGHVLFADPGIARFHLHDRLRRELLRRGHRVTVLCCDPRRATFWQAQLRDVVSLQPARRPAGFAAAGELAAIGGQPGRAAHLERLAGGVFDTLARLRAEVVLLHQERSAVPQLLQFAARQIGVPLLWTGDGLLRHTLQVDPVGLDGDASCRRWTARDYRVLQADRALLDASLAQVLSGALPLPLPHADVVVPERRRRLGDALRAALHGEFAAMLDAVSGWRRALPPLPIAPPTPGLGTLDPAAPFVALLLQSRDDPRMCLDAGHPPAPRALVERAAEAAAQIDHDCQLAVVLPPGERPARWRNFARRRVHFFAAEAASLLAAAAVAVVTVNHPQAFVGMLAGTRIVHLGRARYEVPGVTVATDLAGLPEAVVRGAGSDRPALRRRAATWQLRHGHVWCCPTAPNYNGLLGLVAAVERRFAAAARPPEPPPYRPGPLWPLAVESG